MQATRASWMVLIAWPALAGCESVPDLHFDDADGSAEDARSEASTSDSAIDAEGGASCTGTSPGGSNFCCGTTWCGGACGQADCAACVALSCGAGKVCCVKNGNTMCKLAGQLCPP